MMWRLMRAIGLFLSGLGASLVIGYWLKQEELRTQTSGAGAAMRSSATPEDQLHVVLPKKALDAADGQPAFSDDDMTRLYGVGEKTAEALREAGYSTFRSLADASADSVYEKIQSVHGVTQEKVEGWITEAKGYLS